MGEVLTIPFSLIIYSSSKSQQYNLYSASYSAPDSNDDSRKEANSSSMPSIVGIMISIQ